MASLTDAVACNAAFQRVLAAHPGIERLLCEGFALGAKDSPIEGVSGNTLRWTICPQAFAANGHNTLHGGMSTYICDTLTSLHLLLAGLGPSVSTNMAMSFLAPIVIGERHTVETRIHRSGRRLVHTSADIYASGTDNSLCNCQHTKAFIKSKL